jgi:hypothetical protein
MRSTFVRHSIIFKLRRIRRGGSKKIHGIEKTTVAVVAAAAALTRPASGLPCIRKRSAIKVTRARAQRTPVISRDDQRKKHPTENPIASVCTCMRAFPPPLLPSR